MSENWLTGLGLKEVRLLQGERTLAAVERLHIGYDPTQLLGSETFAAALAPAFPDRRHVLSATTGRHR